MEAVERRSLVLLVPIALVLVFIPPVVDFTNLRTWQVVLYIGGTICVVGSAVLALVIIAPQGVVNLVQDQRERLYVVAVGLFVANVVIIGVLRSWAVYHAYKNPG